jgi:citrate lyase beta subunit
VAAPVLRSLLFLPANRRDRFPKALASGADVVCLDLEDGLAPADKDAGLESALELLRLPRGDVVVAVRVNDAKTERGSRELAALGGSPRLPDAVVLPKVQGPDEIAAAARALEANAVRQIPMIETARGLARVEEIALAAAEHALALMLGGADLTAELGATLDWDALLYARSRLVHAAALGGGLATLDSPSFEVADLDAVGREARAVARLGFTGKAAIHPAQLPAIHQAFRPTEDELERARAVVRAFEASGGGVVVVDGRMVDAPIVRAALRTVALGERSR